MVEDKNRQTRQHNLIMENRKKIVISAVDHLENFDEQTICTVTDMGELIIKGNDLHIDKLNIETGDLVVTGNINSLYYTEKHSSGGLFSKLFK